MADQERARNKEDNTDEDLKIFETLRISSPQQVSKHKSY